MKKVLITGANGLLGQALINTLKEKYVVLGTGIEEKSAQVEVGWKYERLDITEAQMCKEIFNIFLPEIVVNAASYTNVDSCEKEKELCWQVNVKSVENLAKLARNSKSHLIHYSTDYVFDGKHGPYGEGERPSPLGYYGKSKLSSENVLNQLGCQFTIARTCVLYGIGKQVKKNFFLWVLENLEAGIQMRIVTDQYNNPTLVDDLALGTQQIIENRALGIYHLGGKEYLSRYDFSLKVCEVFNMPKELIIPVESKQLNQQARRPLRGGLKIDLAQKKLYYSPRSVTESMIYLKRKLKQDGQK